MGKHSAGFWVSGGRVNLQGRGGAFRESQAPRLLGASDGVPVQSRRPWEEPVRLGCLMLKSLLTGLGAKHFPMRNRCSRDQLTDKQSEATCQGHRASKGQPLAGDAGADTQWPCRWGPA